MNNTYQISKNQISPPSLTAILQACNFHELGYDRGEDLLAG